MNKIVTLVFVVLAVWVAIILFLMTIVIKIDVSNSDACSEQVKQTKTYITGKLCDPSYTDTCNISDEDGLSLEMWYHQELSKCI